MRSENNRVFAFQHVPSNLSYHFSYLGSNLNIIYGSTADQILSGLTRTITGAWEQTTKMDPSKNIVDFHMVPFYNLGQTYLTIMISYINLGTILHYFRAVFSCF